MVDNVIHLSLPKKVIIFSLAACSTKLFIVLSGHFLIHLELGM